MAARKSWSTKPQFVAGALGMAALLLFAVTVNAQKGRARPAGTTGSVITIDNAIAGDNRLQVESGRGGQSESIVIDPVGPAGQEEILYELNHYVDVGANGGGLELGLTTITQEATSSGFNTVTSAGNFAGQNGVINWSSVSSIQPGTTKYQTAVTFTSSAAFGVVRFIQYADIDVSPLSSNNLVVFDVFGSPNFQLMTVQAASAGNTGLRQLYPAVSGATCPGWAAQLYSSLRSGITGSGLSYSPLGSVNVSSTTDSRFPGQTAYGPGDITSAIACDLSPAATSATVTFAVSAESNVLIPVPAMKDIAFFALAIVTALLAAWTLRGRRMQSV